MHLRILSQLGSILVAVALGLALVNPGLGFAAQDEPPPEQPAAPAPAASPTPDRAPSYQRGAPAGALRLTGDPPAVGTVIVEDPLTAPGAIPGPLNCPSGRSLGEFVGEGYILKVTGPCSDSMKGAWIPVPPIPDLVVPDGEIRLEAKVVSGHDRGLLFFIFRTSRDPNRAYDLSVAPQQGLAILSKEQQDAPRVPLAARNDLQGKVSRDDWNEYAIRLQGPNIWILINGQTVLSASDGASDSGGLMFGVERLGDANDRTESAAVFRNLRISRLAE